MKTDELIKALAADATGVEKKVPARLATAALMGGIVAAFAMAMSMGVRPDIMDALATWRFVAKLAIVWLAVVAGFVVVSRLASPIEDARVLKFLAPVVVALVLAVVVEMARVPAEAWGMRLVGQNSFICLMAIPALSLAPLAAGLYALRAGAPTSPGLAGGAAGLLAAAIAAAFYGLHCTDDSPLFVATWYTLATLIVTGLGYAVGSRVLRW